VLAVSDPNLVELAALWVDILHAPAYDLARLLFETIGYDGARKRVRRLLTAGRKRFAAEGVCPWVVLPHAPRDWEHSRNVDEWLRAWRLAAQLFPDRDGLWG
jgi:hypothetical protein